MSRFEASRKFSIGRKLSSDKKIQQLNELNNADPQESKDRYETTDTEKVSQGIFGDVPLTDTERRLLSAALLGDIAALQQCVGESGGRSLQCRDYLGRTALQLAVVGEHPDAVQYLLGRSSLAVIEEGLLHAIKTENVRICDMFLAHPIYSDTKARVQLEFEHGFYDQEEASSSFASDITPIVLAAQCNNFDIVHMLIQKGFNIQTPHHYFCLCTECTNHKRFDRFVHSRSRLNAYMGLASTAYLSLSSDDPICKAFDLSRLLETLAETEKEYKREYKALSETCKTYAVDLLDLCRSNEEVVALLHGGFDTRDLSRIKKAIRYEQKKFVAHASTQEHLMSMWYAGAPWFQHQPFMAKLFLAPLGIMFIPVTAIVYVFLPYTKIGEVLKSPFIKFMNYICSYTTFLLLLFIATVLTSGDKTVNIFSGTEGVVNSLIMFFVAGMFWAECKQLWEEGLRDYFSQIWNYMDITMLALFSASYAIEGVIYTKARHLRSDHLLVSPSDSKVPNPQILSKVLFSVANVMSFARIAYILPASETFGQLQISYGRMLQDVGKFIFIYFTVMIAFICGLTSLYSLSKNEHFSNLMQTTGTLFWATFGMGNSEAPKVAESGSHNLVEFVGFVLYGLYILGAVVVLINMLIAMMSNTFEEIQVCEDIEWKFARAKLWISFVEEGTTLPIPFNIIPTPKSIVRLSVYFKQRNNHEEREDTNEPDGGFETDYKAIMHKIVLRYVHKMKFDKKGESLKDDISEAKDDILKQLSNIYNKLSSRLDNLERDISRFQPPLMIEDQVTARNQQDQTDTEREQTNTDLSSQSNSRDQHQDKSTGGMGRSSSMRKPGTGSRDMTSVQQTPETLTRKKERNDRNEHVMDQQGLNRQVPRDQTVRNPKLPEREKRTGSYSASRESPQRGYSISRESPQRQYSVNTESPNMQYISSKEPQHRQYPVNRESPQRPSPSNINYSEGRSGQPERGRSAIRTRPTNTITRRTPSLEKPKHDTTYGNDVHERNLRSRTPSLERARQVKYVRDSRAGSLTDRTSNERVPVKQGSVRPQLIVKRPPTPERTRAIHDPRFPTSPVHPETTAKSEGYDYREDPSPRAGFQIKRVCSHIRASSATEGFDAGVSQRAYDVNDV